MNNLPNIQKSLRQLAVALVLLALAGSATAGNYKYSFGGGGSLATLKGGDFFKYDQEKSFGFHLGHRLGDNWELGLEYSFYTLTNDQSAARTDSIGRTLATRVYNNQALEFSAGRIGLTAERSFRKPESFWNVSAGGGIGVLFWKMVDVNSQTIIVDGSSGGPRDFGASELILTGLTSLHLYPVNRLQLSLNLRADYLTGAGADFSDEVKDAFDPFFVSAGFRLSFAFGSAPEPTKWRTDSLWAEQTSQPSRRRLSRDGDGDGVNDDIDQCLGTPSGALVSPEGCALDSDFDGVPDGLDDCPGSHPEARGKVDVFGCPIDSDFDGLADYVDLCPSNRPGAMVDSDGCPIDSDGDSVPDGLDDCPHTLPGMAVDKYGCIDLSMFAQPMILNIDYPSGGFEIDPNTRVRVKRLASVLAFVKEIKLEIYGYSDNIGTAKANRQISEKRAKRVLDFLVANGVDQDRMRYEGKGEVNFVASNDNREGRAKNRRIEIIFYR